MTTERRVLRVFLSSTASDMTACREKVRETILRLEQLPIGMETFTPQPTTPVADCRKAAAEADVVIVMVAYRYGSPPSAALGGDGKRSVTWLEVEAAQQAGRAVYAYLIDPQAAWDQLKESDLLNTEPEERQAEILARIRGLKEFKEFLNAHYTWAHFTSADDLAAKVATKLAMHVTAMDPGTVRTARVWRPRVCYPLQPAPHFQGRERLRAELSEWACSRVTPDRVVSLVAVGGTGKTALAEQVLRTLGEQSQFGVLVWSFYENPRTEEFLRTACEYFTGETPTSAGGLLERLQVALTSDEPHLLVLDGLERVQAEGTTGRPRGELEDMQLRRLVRWLAAGQGTRTRALVTSRFPLVDLDDWKRAGHREERLEDLEPVAARAVLRGWGVKGDDATLDALAAPLGFHALSVAVLGSYLGKLCGGDPTKAPTFDRGELAAADPKAAKLAKILKHYAEKLTAAERDLLSRLATFPRGVTVEFLGFLTDAGSQIAGALAGCSHARLLTLLEQLRQLGLVFRYDTPQGAMFTAHPFLRAYFETLIEVDDTRQVHEAVRAKLAVGLTLRPDTYPTNSELIQKYDVLVEFTRTAGKTNEAYSLYWNVLGNYRHLGWHMGQYGRARRLTAGFSKDGTPDGIGAELPISSRIDLAEAWGMSGFFLGDMQEARRCLSWAVSLSRREESSVKCAFRLRHLAEIEHMSGRFPSAKVIAEEAASLFGVSRLGEDVEGWFLSQIAASMNCLGYVTAARNAFHRLIASAPNLRHLPEGHRQFVVDARSGCEF